MELLPSKFSILHQPSLNDLIHLFSNSLKQHFEHVSVNLNSNIDLTKAPFFLASSGLCGNNTLLDIGGVPYLLPMVQKDKKYDLKKMIELCGANNGFLIGAGATSFFNVGKNGEMVCNYLLNEDKELNLIKVATVIDDSSSCQLVDNCKLINADFTDFSLLANLAYSEGNIGPLIEIKVSNWLPQSDKNYNFVGLLRETLTKEYESLDTPVGMSGAFNLSSTSRMHIMPDFSATPIEDKDVNSWLKFFNFPGPTTCVGTITSHDPQHMHLRLDHFHGWDVTNNKYGGHYHRDLGEPGTSYHCVLALGERIGRIDDAFATV